MPHGGKSCFPPLDRCRLLSHMLRLLLAFLAQIFSHNWWVVWFCSTLSQASHLRAIISLTSQMLLGYTFEYSLTNQLQPMVDELWSQPCAYWWKFRELTTPFYIFKN